MSTCVLSSVMPSLQRYKPCIFMSSVVTSTSMQSRLCDVADFRHLVILLSFSCYILTLCKLVDTMRSMHILRLFSKHVL